MPDLTAIPGIGPATALALSERGLTTARDVAGCAQETLVAIPGFGPARAKALRAAAQSPGISASET